MTTLVRLIGALFLSAVALVGATGCGGDTASGGSSTTSSGPSDAATDEGDDASGDDAAPAGGVVFVDASAGPASEIVTITKAGGFDPAEISAAVGDVVKFTAPDDGIFGVIVGDLEGKTVTKGLDEYFRFEKAGTYPVKEDVSGATATVTVK